MTTWPNRNEFPWRPRWWDTGAGRLHFVDEGSGEPVVFVHGVPAWSYNFRGLIRTLAGTYRCVAMDHLGFGLSAKPRDRTLEPATLAGHLEALIEGLRLHRVTLVVHDWGGPLGLAYALRHQRNVARLVLLSRWEEALNDVIVHRLDGVGHYPHEEVPGKVNALVASFVAGTPGDRKP